MRRKKLQLKEQKDYRKREKLIRNVRRNKLQLKEQKEYRKKK